MIFISTGGFKNQMAWEITQKYISFGLNNIELSGGLYSSENLIKLKQMKSLTSFRVHNYFPPPSKPFVFNLASLNPDTLERSRKHAIKAIQCANELESPIYSFHAGFLLDPKVEELGKKIRKRNIFNRNESMDIFVDSVNNLAEYAISQGVELLIENNVLSENNYKEFKTNPFLLATDSECVFTMENTPNNVRLLIDVAHLKVSSNSLHFNPVDFLKNCNQWIHGYHFSDNDGKSDSNHSFDEKSWFWPYLRKDLKYYTIEVYNKPISVLKKLSRLVSKKINMDI
jgi:sugar phosphate isomerase/epimerase